MASSSGSTKVCFNSTCKEALDSPTQGWLCRTGDFADLCDRCGSAFRDGKFCDTYHLNASGWRCCESCGKQIHCGCIVSFHMFILLDAGGIECLNCAKTEFILTPNPTWPSASRFLPGPAERIRDISAKNWRSIAGSGPVPWRQAPSLLNASKLQPEFHSTTPFEVDIPGSIARPLERVANESSKTGVSDMVRDRATGVQNDGQHNLFGGVSHTSFLYTNELATPLSSLPPPFAAKDQKSVQEKASGIDVQRLCPPPSVGKRFSNSNGAGLSHDAQAQHAKPRGGTRGLNQLLPRYWPRITDQELQQISGGSNAKITPLFEKVLSASDAGRIGRLVLPKKCAEAYLPPISQPEGYPLVVQDLKGKDWVLQFRFWPNNNSRMYVLEGVTPCIQSMQLQAGDTVTFSRLEPEGKLVMGFRKAAIASLSDQVDGTSTRVSSSHEGPSRGGITCKSINADGAWSEDKTSARAKRKKVGKMGSSNKMLRLNATLEQVQGFLRPPPNNVPTVVLIEGVEFEDYQEAPIIGSPMVFPTNHVGSLSSRKEEPTPEHLEHMLPGTVEGLDALADLAIRDSKAIPASFQATTRHLRHKPGCTCVVCIQPSGGAKHKSTCTCNVCLMVKRCTQPPTMPCDKKQSEKEVENSGGNPGQPPYDGVLRHALMGNGGQNHKFGFENDANREKSSTPTFKNQNIDLNIQPEREEESSPVSDSIDIVKLFQESRHRHIRQQQLSIDGNHEHHAF